MSCRPNSSDKRLRDRRVVIDDQYRAHGDVTASRSQHVPRVANAGGMEAARSAGHSTAT